MSLYEYSVAESDSITAGDMVAVNERGEVVNVQDRIDDEPMTPYQTSATRRWYMESMATRIDSDRAAMIDRMNRAIPSIAATVRKDGPPRSEYERAKDRADFIFAREMARMGEGSPDMPDAVQPLSGGNTIIFRDGSLGRVMSVEGRNVSVQMEGVLTSVTANVRIDDDRTDAMFFTIDGRTETIPVSRPRPDHEIRILRQLDLARLHRVTVADLRERARVRALSDSAIPLDAPSGGLCKGRWRATRSQVCDDTRVRCRGALGLYAPVLRPNIGMRWSLCRSEGVYLTDWCVRMRWRCTTLRLTGMVSL